MLRHGGPKKSHPVEGLPWLARTPPRGSSADHGSRWARHRQVQLGTMSRIFRLSGGARRDPAIDAWLEQQVPELGVLARMWFGRMRRCRRDVRELMHDGCPVACVEDAAFGYVNVFTAHANVGFFLGAELSDPDGLLEGNGRFMRHVKLRPRVTVYSVALRRLVDEAYLDIKRRLAAAWRMSSRGKGWAGRRTESRAYAGNAGVGPWNPVATSPRGTADRSARSEPDR